MNQAVISHPPMISAYNFSHSARLRFTNPATTLLSQAVTYADLLDCFLVAASATTVFDVFSTVKIRAVEVWAAPTLGTAATATVIFNGAVEGAVGDQVTHTDTSMGIEPAHVLARPNAKSQAAQFQAASNAEAFFLQIPIGSVVDVELSLKQAFVNPVAAQNASVGATAGTFYLRGLDGLSAGTTKLPVAVSFAAI
jgi:hypothetical protein